MSVFFKKMNKSFTLIELLVVMAIIGILATLGFSSYLNSVKAGRDARRKSDLNRIQKALEIYYEDNKAFPTDLTFGNSLCHPDGCTTAEYLKLVPLDPGGANYVYATDATGSYYQLYACIENPNDSGPGVKDYTPSCGSGICNPCRFGLSSSNTTPESL